MKDVEPLPASPSPPRGSEDNEIHARAARRYTATLADIIGQQSDKIQKVNFRELAGPMPSHDQPNRVHPYPGRLLRQIPRFLLGCRQLIRPNDLVLDPFCGSGIVLTEAMQWGIDAWGVDANPLAVLISKVKTTRWNHEDLSAVTDCTVTVAQRSSIKRCTRNKTIAYWYGEGHQNGLGRLRDTILVHPDPSLRDFLWLCLSLTADSLAFKAKNMPVPVRPRGLCPPTGTPEDAFRQFKAHSEQTIERLRVLERLFQQSTALVENGDSRGMLKNENQRLAQLILTSPPYGAAQKYIRACAPSLAWLEDPDATIAERERSTIGRENLLKREISKCQIETLPTPIIRRLRQIQRRNTVRAAIYGYYFLEMRAAISQMAMQLSPSGHVVLVTSENTVAGLRVETNRYLQMLMNEAGFTTKATLRDKIVSRTLPTRRAATAGKPIEQEFVYIYGRGGT